MPRRDAPFAGHWTFRGENISHLQSLPQGSVPTHPFPHNQDPLQILEGEVQRHRLTNLVLHIAISLRMSAFNLIQGLPKMEFDKINKRKAPLKQAV